MKSVMKATNLVIASVVVLLSGMVKFSFILGSSRGFFSLTDAFSPLAGFLGIAFTVAVSLMRSTVSFYLYGSVLNSFFYHIPTFVGSLYWTSLKNKIALVVPVFSMIAFAINPVGIQAMPYTFYWFIPIAIYFLNPRSFFLHALSSTFITHAVGSVIYLYTHNLTVAHWYALIPVVLIERLLLASAMSLVYYLYSMHFSLPAFNYSFFKKQV